MLAVDYEEFIKKLEKLVEKDIENKKECINGRSMHSVKRVKFLSV
jgi:hypothetical protein